ncbi:MAG: phosphoribosyltransferase [Acidobacteria bacterium]|nr:phosphoribosyltransferase [Acidobacteriota bacterium]MBW4045091.1 phosphoribosyltransferase [Acidobacteriota bacterium]
MIFKNRQDAGRQLAKELSEYAGLEDVIVLGVPRGGIPVAYEIARELNTRLDVFLSRKLGVPGQEELAFGAIAAGDGRYLDERIIQAAGISGAQIERITQATKERLETRALLYRGSKAPLNVESRTVILVDDGIATGASIFAAIRALREMKPKRLVIAVPVAPVSTCNWLRPLVDELVVLYTPKDFYAVGQFYDSFSQVSDEEVIELLRLAEKVAKESPGEDCPEDEAVSATQKAALYLHQREISIKAGELQLEGILSVPHRAKGLVLFAHGSGSSRHSPRNQFVAEELHSHGLATLLFDLLTHEEEVVDRVTAELRFDIGLLAGRLVDVTLWVTQNKDVNNLPVGYFGASTGAAAALVAAARLPKLISAVVSRGGRPDLAGESLSSVRAPTLLIVGGLDEIVISLNRQALAKLKCPDKDLILIPGATHLFEEHGTLEQVARITAEWFVRYLAQSGKVQNIRETA